ncbi:uncharacterized protein [Parasteatoda tepidariorum]|uniref:uncharacterized protein n=1 Tax=Parasteatoda tepidariorum TaxID=114398 RepID=UPI001C718032|nr:uncharacterized protein LOC107436214 [Parasteatoda tepidariorum]XP_042899575.1 uncharacterized protein LOC107436214 [Parasteatoda tepidariorum]
MGIIEMDFMNVTSSLSDVQIVENGTIQDRFEELLKVVVKRSDTTTVMLIFILITMWIIFLFTWSYRLKVSSLARTLERSVSERPYKTLKCRHQFDITADVPIEILRETSIEG